MKTARFILSILLALTSSVPAAAQTGEIRIVGKVLDLVTDEPVATAIVRIIDVKRATFTDTLGNFAFVGLEPGMHRFEIARFGYVTLKETIRLDSSFIMLARVMAKPIVLARIDVVVNKLATRRHAVGSPVRSYSAAELAAEPGSLHEFFASRAGVNLAPCGAQTRNLDADCVYVRGRSVEVMVYVDDIRYPSGLPLTMFLPTEFELVEFYPSQGAVRLYTRWFLERVALGKMRLDPIRVQ